MARACWSRTFFRNAYYTSFGDQFRTKSSAKSNSTQKITLIHQIWWGATQYNLEKLMIFWKNDAFSRFFGRVAEPISGRWVCNPTLNFGRIFLRLRNFSFFFFFLPKSIYKAILLCLSQFSHYFPTNFVIIMQKRTFHTEVHVCLLECTQYFV